jgi:hypothetical protein
MPHPFLMFDAIPLTLSKHPSRVIVSTSFGYMEKNLSRGEKE